MRKKLHIVLCQELSGVDGCVSRGVVHGEEYPSTDTPPGSVVPEGLQKMSSDGNEVLSFHCFVVELAVDEALEIKESHREDLPCHSGFDGPWVLPVEPFPGLVLAEGVVLSDPAFVHCHSVSQNVWVCSEQFQEELASYFCASEGFHRSRVLAKCNSCLRIRYTLVGETPASWLMW